MLQGVGAYDIWSDMGFDSPHKVYLGRKNWRGVFNSNANSISFLLYP